MGVLDQQAEGTEISRCFGYGSGRVLWTNELERDTIDIVDTGLEGCSGSIDWRGKSYRSPRIYYRSSSSVG